MITYTSAYFKVDSLFLDTDSPIGVSQEMIDAFMARGLALSEALHAIAELVEIGDGGVDSEFCLVPEIHALANMLGELDL